MPRINMNIAFLNTPPQRNPTCVLRSWRTLVCPMLLAVQLAMGVTAYGASIAAAKTVNCDAINQQTVAQCVDQQPKVKAKKSEPDANENENENDQSAMGTSHAIPKAMWAKMRGVSWHRNLRCPPRTALTLLRVPYWDFGNKRRTGQMIVAKDAAKDLLKVFASLYEVRYPIKRMQPVHLFGGSDKKSMAANNTSAFNCRLKTSKRGLSEHSYGRAVDINPIQNPYVSRLRTQPAAGRSFRSRKRRKHNAMILRNGAVVKAFRKVGWRWGGHWRSAKDYQHFSKSGK